MKKANLKAIIIALFYIYIFSMYSANREIIILLDAQNSENINKTLNTKVIQATDSLPQGLGAISYTAIIALEQQIAPILISKSLIKNIEDHKNLFLDFAKKEYSALRKKYKKKPRFKSKTTFRYFYEQAQYIYKIYIAVNNEIKKQIKKNNKIEKIYDNLLNDTRFSPENTVYSLSNIISDPSHGSMHRQMVAYIMCLQALADENQWIIKEASKELILLIPKKYLDKIQPTKNSVINNKGQKLTDIDLILGLKIKQMPTITIDNMQKFYKERNQNVPYNLEADLQKIFIDKKDNINTYSWTIYISGHGLPTRTINNTIDQITNLESYYKKQKSNKIINKKLEKIRFHTKKLKKMAQETKPYEKGLIASLEPQYWTLVIQYFDKNLNVKLLFYSSCYAGGEHLEVPYLTKEKKPILTHFDIICGPILSIQAPQEMPIIMLPPYSKIYNNNYATINGLQPDGIDLCKKRLKLITNHNFERFFKAINNNEHKDNKKIDELTSYLHPYVTSKGEFMYESIGNISTIRTAMTPKFVPIENTNPNSPIVLSHINKKITNKQVILLTNKEIKEPIIINNISRAPLFFSLIPEIASHTFNLIKATKLNFIDIVNGFLELPELKTDKIFCIKKLHCLPSNIFYQIGVNSEKSTDFNNVIITRNICTTDAIKISPKYEDEYHVNNIYLTIAGVQYKLNWGLDNSKQLTEDNVKIIPCSFKYEYRELLAHAPTLSAILV